MRARHCIHYYKLCEIIWVFVTYIFMTCEFFDSACRAVLYTIRNNLQ